MADVQHLSVEHTRQLREQLERARQSTLASLLTSTAQAARMLDAHRAAAAAHGRLAQTLEDGGRSLAAARERKAAARWERLTLELESRSSHPPAVVLALLGLTAVEAQVEPAVCPVCGSTETVACSGQRLVCHECGHVSRVVGPTRPCIEHHWVPTSTEVTGQQERQVADEQGGLMGPGTLEEHCSACGEVRLVPVR